MGLQHFSAEDVRQIFLPFHRRIVIQIQPEEDLPAHLQADFPNPIANPQERTDAVKMTVHFIPTLPATHKNICLEMNSLPKASQAEEGSSFSSY